MRRRVGKRITMVKNVWTVWACFHMVHVAKRQKAKGKRQKAVRHRGIEPRPHPWKGRILTIRPMALVLHTQTDANTYTNKRTRQEKIYKIQTWQYETPTTFTHTVYIQFNHWTCTHSMQVDVTLYELQFLSSAYSQYKQCTKWTCYRTMQILKVVCLYITSTTTNH